MKRLVLVALACIAMLPVLADTYKGDFLLGDTVRKVYSLSTTAGADVERTVAGTASCVEDGGTTEITAGVTDTGTTEFDGVVGKNLLTIVATAANGFEASKDYDCGVRASTLNGVTASYEVVSFSIENRSDSRGRILARDTANTGSTVSVVNVDTAGTITSTNQYIVNRLWNATAGWDRAITATTTGSPDTITIYPDSPSATADNDVLYITRDIIYPISLDGTDVNVTSFGPTPVTVTQQMAANIVTHYDNNNTAISSATDLLGVIGTNVAAAANGVVNGGENLTALLLDNQIVEDAGSTDITARGALSLLLSERLGACDFTAGSPDTWVCEDPSGTVTRFTMTYGTDNGDRSVPTLVPDAP